MRALPKEAAMMQVTVRALPTNVSLVVVLALPTDNGHVQMAARALATEAIQV